MFTREKSDCYSNRVQETGLSTYFVLGTWSYSLGLTLRNGDLIACIRALLHLAVVFENVDRSSVLTTIASMD